jgi:hypothetical protein
MGLGWLEERRGLRLSCHLAAMVDADAGPNFIPLATPPLLYVGVPYASNPHPTATWSARIFAPRSPSDKLPRTSDECVMGQKKLLESRLQLASGTKTCSLSSGRARHTCTVQRKREGAEIVPSNTSCSCTHKILALQATCKLY